MANSEAGILSDLILAVLDSKSARSLQQQIYRAIQEAITAGVLGPGHRMPSTRLLAEELGLSRITVSLAYDKLSSEGYVTTSKGRGTFVANVMPAFRSASPHTYVLPPAQAAQAALSRRAKEVLISTRGMSERDGAFVPGVADTSNFPFHIWQKMQNRYAKKPYTSLTGYGIGGGYMPLRQALSEYLQISRSVKCKPEQVLITMGTNQSLDLCARMLADVDDVALVEDPCNWSTSLVWRAAGLKVVPVPIDDDGICSHLYDFDARPDGATPKLLFTTPSHQYPMGVAMGVQRRRTLLQQAYVNNFWIIEDDYDSEFRYDTLPLPSLQGLDEMDRVIYLGTFSKVMYPGLRMSYLVVPPQLIDAFSTGLAQLYRPGQLTTQAAMADFISEGYFATHIKRMRAVYGDRQQELRRSLETHLGDAVNISSGRAGLHLSINFNEPIDLAVVSEKAHERGVVLRELGRYHHSQTANLGYILGYGGVRTELIDQSVKTLLSAYEYARTMRRTTAMLVT